MSGAAASRHDCADLVALFDGLFAASERTVLRGGYDEPLYLPTDGDRPAEIRFTRDHYASALHEVAHWCIAGRRRRRLRDYGYWYHPERDPRAQESFEAAEAAPQALEWAFHVAAGSTFHLSRDNFGVDAAGDRFAVAVAAAAAAWWRSGFPPRAGRFLAALAARYGGCDRLRPEAFAVSAPVAAS